jgi:hypothetical protein
MEALQVLKFSFKQDRLTFTDDPLAAEKDYTIAGPVTAKAIQELISTGKVDKLGELLANATETPAI